MVFLSSDLCKLQALVSGFRLRGRVSVWYKIHD
ncbi:unnamed protein product [Linum tenue]|uniref:Uncharacterized protein n=1 Tax=Linum tenue TaxID=586396 RepID=A0AAV0MFR8_9ROSI|nr:unnamed protein product [Linum tenue]